MTAQEIDEKYPESFFDHFLAMFNNTLNEEEIENHINIASAFEGIGYVRDLKKEIKLILKNGDEGYFISKMQQKGYDNFNKDTIQLIVKISKDFIQTDKE